MPPAAPVRRLIGRRIRDARREAGLSQDHLADRIGCSKAQLSLMESGRRTVSPERAAAIERALELHDHPLVDAVHWADTPAQVRHKLRDTQSRQHAIVDQIRAALDRGSPLESLRRLIERAAPNLDDAIPALRQIPLINNVAAGALAEFTDLDYPAAIADEYVACPDVADPHAFAARVVGDSMSPDYREGEIVVFSPAAPVTDGTDCFVRLQRDHEMTFKRVRFEDERAAAGNSRATGGSRNGRAVRNGRAARKATGATAGATAGAAAAGGTIVLQPLNQKYQPRRIPRTEVAALYAAVYVLRKVTSAS